MIVGYRMACCAALLAASACLDSPESTAKAKSAVAASLVGVLMPFGGGDGSCVVVGGGGPNGGTMVGSCRSDRAVFLYDASTSTIRTAGDPLMCLDVLYANLAAGDVGQVTCSGGLAQQFDISGGQITSRLKSDTQQYCLDVRYASHNPGTTVSVVPCNGGDAQSFLPAGYKIAIASAPLADAPASCLSLAPGPARVGTTLELRACTRGEAQSFVLDTSLLLHPANQPKLCVAAGPLAGAVGTLTLQSCNAQDSNQEWAFQNAGRFPNGKPGTRIYAGANSCLDAKAAGSAASVHVGVAPCNTPTAQAWQPFLVGAPRSL